MPPKKQPESWRFARHVSPRPVDGCWIWTGARDPNGYGRFMADNGPELAHRAAYRLLVGAVPDDKHLCHTCDNPSCVNPGHVYAGTPADNVRDMFARGRAPKRVGRKGEASTSSVLTWDQVREIRRRSAAGARNADLAKEYGVTAANVWNIVRHKTWKEVV